MVQAIPQGYTSVTPCLILEGCSEAIAQYKEGLGAKELSRMVCPETGKVMHAELQIGNARIMVQDTFPGQDAAPANLFLYLEDCDAALTSAKAAGLTETMPAEDMFWGDRLAAVKDDFGMKWNLATHKKDMTEDEVMKAAEQWAKNMKDNKAA